MSRVLLPDEGSVSVTGGVAPLIELTGGFRGELSARDNITLTAGLHGLSPTQMPGGTGPVGPEPGRAMWAPAGSDRSAF